MKLGIMQPYFFPYAQQFRHIAQCDKWIVFDIVKYSRKSWMSRNRIANRDTVWSYISVPVAKGASNSKIADARISDQDWRNVLRKKLAVYEKAAPFFNETMTLFETSVAPPVETLADLNFQIICKCSEHLGIETPIERLSKMSLDIPDGVEAGEWALLISKAVGAEIYSNAPGGRHLFNPDKYAMENIKLEFYEPKTLVYETPSFVFENNLSIVDTMMWIGADALAEFIHS